MFTIEQIDKIHSKVKSGADFPNYIKEIKKLGVTAYKVYVVDNHKEYYGKNDFKISSKKKYEPLNFTKNYDKETFQKALLEHQNGKSSYFEFCEICAKTGVESWFVCLEEMTCTYYDVNGNEVLIEKIPS